MGSAAGRRRAILLAKRSASESRISSKLDAAGTLMPFPLYVPEVTGFDQRHLPPFVESAIKYCPSVRPIRTGRQGRYQCCRSETVRQLLVRRPIRRCLGKVRRMDRLPPAQLGLLVLINGVEPFRGGKVAEKAGWKAFSSLSLFMRSTLPLTEQNRWISSCPARLA